MSSVNIVMYHYVRELGKSRFPKIKGLEYSAFKEQIGFLKKNFKIIRMEDMVSAYENNEILPENACLLTFDDGYIDHFVNVFPFLYSEGLQGSFFIPGKTFAEHKLLDVNKIHFILASANIFELHEELLKQIDRFRKAGNNLPENSILREEFEKKNRFDNKETVFVKRMLQTALPEEIRHSITDIFFERYVGVSEETFAYELYMNSDQIKCMREAGMHIGLHGYDHYWLGNLEDEKVSEDLDKSLEVMKPFIDSDAWVMNYPYGSWNENVICLLKERGCKAALATEVRIADLKRDNRFALPRFDTNDFPPISNRYESL